MRAGHRGMYFLLTAALTVWVGFMGALYLAHLSSSNQTELGYVTSSGKLVDSGTWYYDILREGKKIGYRSERWTTSGRFHLCQEENVLKLNLAGLSREIFIQSVVTIDTTRLVTQGMEFSLHSGSHVATFSSTISGDSLNITVRKDILAPNGRGTFIVDEQLTYPAMLPYLLHRTTSDNMSFMVFDPLVFSASIVELLRTETGMMGLGDSTVATTRYEYLSPEHQTVLWLDDSGRLLRAEGYPLFGDTLGDLTVRRSLSRNVFSLPVDVPLGQDILDAWRIIPEGAVPAPRETSYIKVALNGIRAAFIDVTASNKLMTSVQPVTFEIYNHPVATGDQARQESVIAGLDTSLVGTSPYIQALDARMVRTSRDIVRDAEPDTLAMAHAIRRWVSDSMTNEPGLQLTRSIDILRDRKGCRDSYTKLYTALSRAIGIPTQINLGLVADGDVFRYHSWPSVYIGGEWHDLDPFYGQDVADATHIALVRGDFEQLVELLRLIDGLSLTILDYR